MTLFVGSARYEEVPAFALAITSLTMSENVDGADLSIKGLGGQL